MTKMSKTDTKTNETPGKMILPSIVISRFATMPPGFLTGLLLIDIGKLRADDADIRVRIEECDLRGEPRGLRNIVGIHPRDIGRGCDGQSFIERPGKPAMRTRNEPRIRITAADFLDRGGFRRLGPVIEHQNLRVRLSGYARQRPLEPAGCVECGQ